MTDINDPHDQTGPASRSAEDVSRDRLAEISHLFDEIRSLVAIKIEEEGPVTGATITKLLTKVGDLQSAHLMVLKEEGKFHDKFAQDDHRAGPDYDAIRRDIGRALDRIRDALDADDVSKGSGP